MKYCCLLSALPLTGAFMHSPLRPRGYTTLNSQSPYLGGMQGGATGASFQGSEESYAAPKSTKDIWDSITSIPVQGGSLRTCSFEECIDRVEVHLRTEGRPLNSNVELWQGPDNSPQRMKVYLEDGNLRPFRSVIETPGDSNAIAIRNTGELEFPLAAAVEALGEESPAMTLASMSKPRTVQGGAVFTTPFTPAVASVQIMLKTDGRPLNARIELLQGPNNNKQVMELYSEDGLERPFYAVLDTPGHGNVVRIVNTATVEFPIFASIEPYIEEVSPDSLPVSSSDMIWT